VTLDRRTFLRQTASTAVLPWLAACAPLLGGRAATPPFLHGVASGDPGTDRVILWTRVTPDAAGSNATAVQWEVATEPGFARRVAGGTAYATAERDHTVKLDVGGLAPGTTYYYRFATTDAASPVGRTRTLPVGHIERLRLAFCSCAALEAGYFGAYAHIAARADLDAVLHLGDYIYEGAAAPHAPGHALGRLPTPNREILSLADYRGRYAQYRLDTDLQELHRQHPMIALWDDHEFADNAWGGGAQNHQVGEGPWEARRAAGVRAYREWLPIREWDASAGGAAYRSFRFGDLADLLMLETRLGRDAPILDRKARESLERAERSMLGAAQERWLADEMVASQRDGIAWRLLGQQVVFASMRDREGFVHNVDAWDGYPATRDRLFDLWQERDLRDNVILTGDVHSSWALDVPRDAYAEGGYDAEPGGDVWAVEFVTPGISSRSGVRPDQVEVATASAYRDNPHLHWIDLAQRGYALLDVTHERVRCEWYHVASVEQRGTPEHLAAVLSAARGGAGLVRLAAASKARSGAAALAP
jgi:alkaline phosphatase D